MAEERKGLLGRLGGRRERRRKERAIVVLSRSEEYESLRRASLSFAREHLPDDLSYSECRDSA